MSKSSDSIRACSIEMAPVVERLKAASKTVSKSADALKDQARQTSIDSAIRRATPRDFLGIPGPTVHSTRGIRPETPFADAPTQRLRHRR